MGTLAARVQMRAFQVQAQKAGNALFRRRDPGSDDPVRRPGPVGDQRGQQACHPQPGMGRADRCQRRHIGGPIHRHPAAAVHLQIDQSWREDTPVESHIRPSGRAQPQHPPVVHDKGLPMVQPCAVKDRGPREGLAHHIVSVTLRRCGGVSGSNPRLRASPSMKA